MNDIKMPKGSHAFLAVTEYEPPAAPRILFRVGFLQRVLLEDFFVPKPEREFFHKTYSISSDQLEQLLLLVNTDRRKSPYSLGVPAENKSLYQNLSEKFESFPGGPEFKFFTMNCKVYALNLLKQIGIHDSNLSNLGVQLPGYSGLLHPFNFSYPSKNNQTLLWESPFIVTEGRNYSEQTILVENPIIERLNELGCRDDLNDNNKIKLKKLAEFLKDQNKRGLLPSSVVSLVVATICKNVSIIDGYNEIDELKDAVERMEWVFKFLAFDDRFKSSLIQFLKLLKANTDKTSNKIDLIEKSFYDLICSLKNINTKEEYLTEECNLFIQNAVRFLSDNNLNSNTEIEEAFIKFDKEIFFEQFNVIFEIDLRVINEFLENAIKSEFLGNSFEEGLLKVEEKIKKLKTTLDNFQGCTILKFNLQKKLLDFEQKLCLFLKNDIKVIVPIQAPILTTNMVNNNEIRTLERKMKNSDEEANHKTEKEYTKANNPEIIETSRILATEPDEIHIRYESPDTTPNYCNLKRFTLSGLIVGGAVTAGVSIGWMIGAGVALGALATLATGGVFAAVVVGGAIFGSALFVGMAKLSTSTKWSTLFFEPPVEKKSIPSEAGSVAKA